MPPIDLEKSEVKFSLSTAAKVLLTVLGGLGTFISFVVWLTTLHTDVSTLKRDLADFREEARYHWRLQSPEPGFEPRQKPGQPSDNRVGMVAQ